MTEGGFSCPRLEGFMRQCGMDNGRCKAEWDEVVAQAAGGDCPFNRRCPQAGPSCRPSAYDGAGYEKIWRSDPATKWVPDPCVAYGVRRASTTDNF